LEGIQNFLSEMKVQITYAGTNDSNAPQLAREADVALVFVGTDSSEGSDRPTLDLGGGQDEFVETIVEAQPKTVVIANAPGAVLMPWIDKVSAVLCAFLPGQEDGTAIAEVLFGAFNPGGKLPLTFPLNNNQTPVNTTAQFPGIDNEANYTEGIFVGYRWYDQYGVDPLFPFGHGLSYTTFDYYNMSFSGSIQESGSMNITAIIRNNGRYYGSEVAQLYLGFPAYAGEPPKVLRGFQKVWLHPGDETQVLFELTTQDLAIWDVISDDWVVIQGTFNAFIGSSSQDIRLQGVFNN